MNRFSGGWRWRFARFLPLIATVAVVLVVGIIFLIYRSLEGGVGDHVSSASPTGSSQDEPAEIGEDNAELADTKQEIQRLTRGFVAVFYSRDAKLLSGSVAEREARYRQVLEPFVTAKFLETYLRPLDTPPDEALLEGGGIVKARAVGRVVGHLEGQHAEQTITVRHTTMWPDEPSVVIETIATIYLTEEDGTWYVEAIIEES